MERGWGQICNPSQLQAISNIHLDAGQRIVLIRCKGGPGVGSSRLGQRARLLVMFLHPRQETLQAPSLLLACRRGPQTQHPLWLSSLSHPDGGRASCPCRERPTWQGTESGLVHRLPHLSAQ